jgi:cysteinyl-tRNA synthetase
MLIKQEVMKRMKIYNTLSRKKEEFVPIKEGEVSIYVCGPTVYNFFHIGNARPLVVFDTFRKYMEYRGYKVKYVQNFTDVDDKIINRAKEEKITAPEVSEKYIKEYFEDAGALNVRKADVHPKVSEHIPEIISFVQTLIDKGFAYEADGDVYFSTRKFPEYGKLSGQNIDDLESGARIAIGEVKQDPLDFALWKARKEESEIAWESPWGMGRPGWHIECSAMSKKHLGPTIDIHAGGQDLQFPHHENEIAQSECCNGVPFAHYWMHNAYITMDKEKMSKSKGNFFTVRDIRKKYSGEEIRFFLLSGQYRSPIDFSDALMEQSRNSLERMKNCKDNLVYLTKSGSEGEMTDAEKAALAGYDKYRQAFIEAMDDDLNTADGISAVFELITAINTAVADGATRAFAQASLDTLMEFCNVLGLLQAAEEDDTVDPEIQKLIDERQEARKARNFARADEIRDQLKAQGITLKDTPQGVQIIKE